jgi:hypothetical protein
MGATCGAGTAYPSGYLSSSPIFRVARSLVLYFVFCRSMFVLLLLGISLTVPRITASDYLFEIFKLFVNDINLDITYKFNNSHQC